MATRSASATAKVRAWDLPTRAFHWTLVTLLFGSWATFEYAEKLGDNTLRWHRYSGYAILCLLVWRLLWGFVGSSTSRWSSFVRWPWTAARYFADVTRNRERHFLGHNPMGAYMILALLGAVALQASLGLFTVEHNDTAWGPLYKLVPEAKAATVNYLHTRLFNYLILPLIALHITANALYGFFKNDPLVRAMITGTKPAGRYEDATEAMVVRRPTLLALACLLIAGAIVFGIIAALGGKLFY